jgi:hypothetical protein
MQITLCRIIVTLTYTLTLPKTTQAKRHWASILINFCIFLWSLFGVCTAGCPSPPTITSEEYSREKYSYDLTWTVLSQYPVLQHQIQYWLKVGIYKYNKECNIAKK